jgi:O-antigen/teichoic acid export membrane protein
LKTKSEHHNTGIVIKSASTTLVGIVFSLFISFISGFIVARVIGPAAFGIFNLSRTLCESVTVFTKVGFDIGVVRHFGERQGPEYKESNAIFLKMMLTVVSCLAFIPVLFIYFGGGTLLEKHVYQYANFNTVMMVMALSIPLMSLTQVLGGVFRGNLQINPRVIAEYFLQPASRLILIVLLFLIGLKLWAVITGTVLSFVFSVVYLLLLCKTVLFTGYTATELSGRQKLVLPWKDLVVVGKYSIIISLTVSVALLLQRSDIMMLGYFAPSEQVGQYSVIQMVVSLIPVFNSSLNQAVAPMLAGLYADGNIDEMRGLIHQHTRWVIIATLPLFLIIAFYGNVFIGIFGKGYVVNVPVITLLALAQLVIAVLSSAGFMLSMTGKHMYEFYTMVFALACSVTLNYFLIPKYGIMGAAVGTLFAVVLANILRSIQVYKVHGIFPIGGGMTKPFLLGIASFSCIVFIAKYLCIRAGIPQAAVISIVFVLFYGLLIVKFGLIEDDRVLLNKMLNKMKAFQAGIS